MKINGLKTWSLRWILKNQCKICKGYKHWDLAIVFETKKWTRDEDNPEECREADSLAALGPESHRNKERLNTDICTQWTDGILFQQILSWLKCYQLVKYSQWILVLSVCSSIFQQVFLQSLFSSVLKTSGLCYIMTTLQNDILTRLYFFVCLCCN